MTTNFNVDVTKRGVNGFGLQFCDTVFSATLGVGADTALAVPLTAAMGAPTATSFNKFMAIMSVDGTGNVYVALNAVATVPAGAAFAATTAELIPRNSYFAKMVKAGDVIHFVSPAASSVTVAFYAIQE
jgi:hypothetical protein